MAVLKFMNAIEPSKCYAGMINSTPEAGERGDLRGLRIAERDLEEGWKYLPASAREALDRTLRERFGRGLSDASKAKQRKVARVIKRGSIREADEYRLLKSYVDDVDELMADLERTRRINGLLSVFEDTGGKDK